VANATAALTGTRCAWAALHLGEGVSKSMFKACNLNAENIDRENVVVCCCEVVACPGADQWRDLYAVGSDEEVSAGLSEVSLPPSVAMSSLTILELAVGASRPTKGASFSIPKT
jgi:hypothetical protein